MWECVELVEVVVDERSELSINASKHGAEITVVLVLRANPSEIVNHAVAVLRSWMRANGLQKCLSTEDLKDQYHTDALRTRRAPRTCVRILPTKNILGMLTEYPRIIYNQQKNEA